MDIIDIKKHINVTVFTSEMLKAILSDTYKNLNKKISQMTNKGELVRLKQGIYVLGKKYRERPVDKIAAANTLQKPSYVSYEYALAHYGLIPERVYEITSATLSKTNTIETEIGRFGYRKVPKKAYSIGINWLYDEKDGGRLIATPEKALCDKVRTDKRTGKMSQKQLAEYLEYDLRLEWHDLVKLNSELIREIAIAYGSKTLRELGSLIGKRSKYGY
jgi:predicted transcriptional regulator of viral defense system